MLTKQDVTRVLAEWDRNPEHASELLTPVIYTELRQLAASYLRRERSSHTLQPTALVHEAWMRICGSDELAFDGRAHFLGIAARVMRQVLVDSARKRNAAKRGAGSVVQLDEALVGSTGAAEFMDLNDAIEKLKAWDERKCRVIELRYFAGLKRLEIATALQLTEATVKRDLTLAEAFLRRELGP